MVLRAGENVYCAEVEAAIYEHPAVYEAAVFGVPHERLGEEVAVAIYPRAGQSVSADELQAHVAERLAAFKVPSRCPDRRRAAPAQRRRQVPQARPARAAHRLSAAQPVGEAGARRGGGAWPRRPRSAMHAPASGVHGVEPHGAEHVVVGLEGDDVDAAPAQPAGLGVEQRARPGAHRLIGATGEGDDPGGTSVS